MKLQFAKMHGLGNDFVVIDGISRPVNLSADQIKRIADRRFGVGCDQLLLVEPPHTEGVNFHYRIFNPDGGEVEQCGNGARCVARFVRDRDLVDQDAMSVTTGGGSTISLLVEVDGQVSVDMGRPRLEPGEIPFIAKSRAYRYPITVDGIKLQIGAVSMGNPHAVLEVGDVDSAPVESLGPSLASHERFPNSVNVGFMEVVDRGLIRLRVFERGVGETLACGTGACAAVVCGRVQGLLDEYVRVDLPGGSLDIRWDGHNHSVTMKGPAVQVFEGGIEL
jgi:diaminopimelate epimerase